MNKTKHEEPQLQLWNIINDDFGAAFETFEEIKALNSAIYYSAENNDLTKSEKLNDLLSLIKAQRHIIDTAIKGMDLISDKLIEEADRKETPPHTTE